jgi:glycosyltransferase involved in cell wall biosynthesis
MNPKISVLVTTYNRARFLPQCLESLIAQTLAPFEIIVIDDGSTDETPEVARRYRERIVYLRKPNGGKSSALNLGMTAVAGDYAWILDDDDVAIPYALERLVAPLVADARLGMTFSSFNVAKSRADDSLDLPGVAREHPDFPDCDLHLMLLKKGCILGQSGILVRTSVYRQVGPFDTNLVRALDYDMALRLSRACTAAMVPGPVFVARQHEGPRGSAKDRFGAEERFLKWRAYDKIVMRKVRVETPIEEFVSRVERPEPLPPLLLRQAYLQRAGTMAHYGLYAEVLEDLRSAFEIDDRTPLCAEEREMWDNIYAYFFEPGEDIWTPQYINRLRRVCDNQAARDLPFLLARQLYWCAHYCWETAEFAKAARLTRTALRLVGIDGVVRMIRYKIGRKTGMLADLAADSEAVSSLR